MIRQIIGGEQENMRSIELFAGIGGIALACEWAGIKTVAFCEREPFCQKVLNKHWPTVPIFDDVKTLNRKALEEKGVIEPGGTIDIISGGFPCQPFSVAGKKKGRNDDRDLWPEMFRIIQELKPTWVVGENVANFVNMELERTLIDLESEGYETQTFIIPACGVNAKHKRDRTFVVAYSDSKRCQECNFTDQSNKKGFVSGNVFERTVCNPNSKPKSQTNKSISTFGSEQKTWESTSWESWREAPRTYWQTNKPPICGVVDGLSRGLDKSRLKALGNAVVPQQIYPIFKYIVEIERMNE